MEAKKLASRLAVVWISLTRKAVKFAAVLGRDGGGGGGGRGLGSTRRRRGGGEEFSYRGDMKCEMSRHRWLLICISCVENLLTHASATVGFIEVKKECRAQARIMMHMGCESSEARTLLSNREVFGGRRRSSPGASSSGSQCLYPCLLRWDMHIGLEEASSSPGQLLDLLLGFCPGEPHSCGSRRDLPPCMDRCIRRHSGTLVQYSSYLFLLQCSRVYPLPHLLWELRSRLENKLELGRASSRTGHGRTDTAGKLSLCCSGVLNRIQGCFCCCFDT